MAARTAVVAGTATHVAGNVQRRQQRRWAEKDAAQQPPPPQQQDYPPAQGYAEPQPPSPPPPPPASASQPAGGDLVSQLQQLGDLHTQGAITDEEFTAAKAKLLGN
jgi:hypothetical protein